VVQVTGVNTFEEMIQKFSAQRSNTQALQEEKRQVRGHSRHVASPQG
jgi:flagellar basal body rod protein FlgC